MDAIDKVSSPDLIKILKSRNCDILGSFSSDALIEEITQRDDMPPSDLEDIDLEYIINYVEANGHEVVEGSVSKYLSELQGYKLKDLLCDVVGVNHHTSKEELLKLLGERI